ncbi:MAG TPA: HAMP domain-containing sensor histidine kinase [Chloroflexota bacterium]|nr:HAMP domain-containing sensor histidine kinase [Chloroflexota bacterium]
MSLRGRLTLLYGGLLAVVLLALGVAANLLIQARFADQTRSALTSTAQYIYGHYRVVGTPQRALAPRLPAQQPFSSSGVYAEIVGYGGRVIDRWPGLTGQTIPLNSGAIEAAFVDGKSTLTSVSLHGQAAAAYYTPLIYSYLPNTRAVLLVVKSESDTTGALNLFTAEIFGGEAVLLAVVVLVTWLVAGSALRPIQGMTRRAAAIAAAKDFSGRVPEDPRTAELHRLALTFNDMLASLQEAYANQKRFLADASHELRTPLTVIQSNLQFLEAAPDATPTERLEALQAATVETERMAMLVADLLALSQADAGFEVAKRAVELDRVVVDALRRIGSRERQRGPRMVVGTLEEAVVEGDGERLLQLFVILLDNAVKYTPRDGEVKVEVRGAGDSVVVSVSDTGIGIPAAERPHIFDRFYRSPSARSMGEGSGLGLPIARWIVEAHGGSIEVQDGPSGGTTFVVTLPRLTAGVPAVLEPASVA